MEKSKMNIRGQLTIFIIAAIMIAVAIVAIFFFYGDVIIQSPDKSNPQKFIDECAKKAVEPSIKKVLENGGLLNPVLKISYYSENYTYLCYQNNYYLSCVNQMPNIKDVIEKQIKQDSENRIKECFDSLIQELENKNYAVTEGALIYSINLAPKTVILNINKQFDISKQDQGSQSFVNFNVRLMSPLYDLSMVAREIVNQESQYCNFEYNGFMLLYPEYDIKRISYGESRIYKLVDRRTGKEFKFAVRSCAFPPGY